MVVKYSNTFSIILLFVNVRPALFYAKTFVYNSVAIYVIMIKLLHHPVPVPQLIVRSFKD